IKSLDDDEKMTLTQSYGHSGQRGGAQFLNVINESGLYTLIFKSIKPEAKQFRRWVTHEVLPDIRKYGMYLSPNAQDAFQVNREVFDTVVNKYIAEKGKVKALEEQIRNDAQYTTLGKVVSALPGCVTVGEAANFLTQHGITTMGRNRLFEWARKEKLLCSQKRRWNKPTQKGIESGIVNIAIGCDGERELFTQAMITAEGLEKLIKTFFPQEYPLAALWEFDDEDNA
ncbi:MAG: phage antirepressor KilAC domain-containing protein, partial [Synergistaceae bacterium]|nr:phage antirepressor KilAC domain-containing protein [Synergistaceae bacterium]